MRNRLGNRRACDSFICRFDNNNYHTSIGFFEDGSVAEIFIDSDKVTSLMSSMLKDSAIIISLCLQNGVSIFDIKESLLRMEDKKKPASPVSEIIDQTILYLKEI